MVVSLAQVVAEKTDALRLLEAAFDDRISTDGGHAVVLDSMLEAARAKGFYGSLELAAGVLRSSGRLQLQKEPRGKWQAIRRCTALAVVEPRSTALVTVEARVA